MAIIVLFVEKQLVALVIVVVPVCVILFVSILMYPLSVVMVWYKIYDYGLPGAYSFVLILDLWQSSLCFFFLVWLCC